MAGAAELMAALTGGSKLEQDAYAKQAARIISAQNQQSLLDKRVSEAFMAARQADAYEQLIKRGVDPLVIAELATQGKAFEEMQGIQQQNTARGNRAKMVEGAIMSGTPMEDVFNMFGAVSQDSLLGPTNVRVADQADAAIAFKGAQTEAAQELVNKRRISQDLIKANIELKQDELSKADLEIPTHTLLRAAWPDVTDEEGYVVPNPEIAQFLEWWPNAVKTNPGLKKFTDAQNEFKRMKRVAPSPAEAFNGVAPQPTVAPAGAAPIVYERDASGRLVIKQQ